MLAGPHEFDHKGKTYTVSLITQNVKLAFEKGLFARAKRAALELRDLLSPEDYLAHVKALNDDYISGQYAFESERGLAAVSTISGMVLLTSLLFGCPEDEVVPILTERKDEVIGLIQMIFKESFPGTDKEGSNAATAAPDPEKAKNG